MTDFVFGLEPPPPDPPDPVTPIAAYEYGDDEYLHLLLALMPPGAAWRGARIKTFLSGLAPEFARVQARAKALLAELNPATAVEMLDEHEAINGLPDPCAVAPTTTEGRQAALAARLLDNAGHNPADYVAVAEALGHAGTTIHRRPYPPFRAGIGRAGQRIYSDQWAHVFGVAYMTDELAAGGWFVSGVGTSQTSTTKVAPDGDADARELTFGATSGYAYKNISPTPPTSVQVALWMRVASGTATVTLGIYQTSTLIASAVHEVDTVWRRYVLRAENEVPLSSVRLSASSEVVEVWGECAGRVDDVLECRFSKISQAHSVPEFRVIGEYVEPLE